ncbi:MAG: carbonic anhydrase [Hyphomicrobiales bacterium]
MDRRDFVKALAAAAACPLCAGAARAAEAGPHWSYEGATGTRNWGRLSSGFRACATGTRQSPLDIVEPIRADLPALAIDYRGGVAELVNNGHTIQANMAKGSTLSAGKQRYDLIQFHFHHPGEHQIDSKSFAMECHFVHADSAGALGVLGVLMVEGAANPAFAGIVELMPKKEGVAKTGLGGIDPKALLPAGRAYYRYSGSLTIPPCSEEVDWMLFADTITVAASDIAEFATLYKMNARPAQKGFRRFVLQSM